MTEPASSKPELYLRAGLFWVGMALSTVLFALFSPLLLPLKWHGRFRLLSQWTRFNLWWLTLTCGLRYTVTGTEYLGGEARVLMCKHQSAWETLALQQFIPPQVWVLKQELLRIPFFGWALGMLEPIALDRAAGRKAMDQLVAQGLDRLDRGLWVVLFPEGTRTPPGHQGRYKVGGAVLAARSGRPVIPVAHNAGLFWPRNSFLKYPGTIQVEVGPPIPTEGRKPEAIMKDVQAWIESRTAVLCGLPGPDAGQPHG
ncbi:1-acyl-sn-glycerol-3-phosphate acyltransferase [Ectothiorhodospira shaposhnikovii]|uniref:lysophospholipid acyltransferase family protein n=1 Tax=Ectothiorhodospira shaposhnikovii TaxID=1054 RepID=UPI001906EC64|nr:lysophospholipid acyltransferase family protein [Ectothiorhodospira shaposhnikovii]MBK1672883.1 1-acyl-sn-glycerol-3-phosphate acyltransferase [Ectothiorhodospira shaposhnikovii]